MLKIINLYLFFMGVHEVREQLALLGGHDRLLAKIDAMLALHSLHGGQCLSLRNWLDQAKELIK